MSRSTFSLLLVLFCASPSWGGAGFSDMARTSEFWIVEPFGLSRHPDEPREVILFQGRLVKTDDWMRPQYFDHDKEIVRGVWLIACVNNTAIVGYTFAGDYFAIHLPGREIHTGLSHADWSTLLAKWNIQNPKLLSWDEAQRAFNPEGIACWLWFAAITVVVVVLIEAVKRRHIRSPGREPGVGDAELS